MNDSNFYRLINSWKEKFKSLNDYMKKLPKTEIDKGWIGNYAHYIDSGKNLKIIPTIRKGLIFTRPNGEIYNKEVATGEYLEIEPGRYLLEIQTNNEEARINFFGLADFTPLGIELTGKDYSGRLIEFEPPQDIPERTRSNIVYI